MSRRGWSHEPAGGGETVEWYTPPEIFTALDLVFDLDPCAAEGGAHVPARRYFTKADDGLSQEWAGTVWVNPPYGKETSRWMDKFIEHGDGIALVFARTDPAWGQKILEVADAVLFISGRIKFINGTTMQPAGTPGAGSMLVAFGEKCVTALRKSGLGVVMGGLK